MTDTILTFHELKAKGVPFKRMWLRKLCRDGEFPEPVQLGKRRIGWYESEIDKWLAERPRTHKKAAS